MTESVLTPASAARPRPALPVWLIAAFAVLMLVFHLVPAIDLAVSGLFVDASRSFPLEHDQGLLALNRAVNGAAKAIAWTLTFATPIAWLAHALRWRALRWLIERRRQLLFLALTFALGPGLLVNSLLKEHWGRARPATIVEFGGSKRFTPVLERSDQCARNCAFASGHAAAATMPVTGYFIARSRRSRRAWLVTGIVGGFTIGLARMVTGGHFLSDIVFAVLSTYVVAALCAAWVLRPRAPASLAR